MDQNKIGIIISPAKRLSLGAAGRIQGATTPQFCQEASVIMKELKKWSPGASQNNFGLSERYGNIAYERNQNWKSTKNLDGTKPAIFLYNGDVFQGMRSSILTDDELKLAQGQLRILSALYGLLKPLDLIQPYRLQMSSPLLVQGAGDLYTFWKEKITSALNEWILTENIHVLINLASEEYYSVIDAGKIKIPVIKPVFRQIHQSELKSLSLFLKRARGMMVRFILSNKITDYEHLKAFDMDGYLYNADKSSANRWVFIREG